MLVDGLRIRGQHSRNGSPCWRLLCLFHLNCIRLHTLLCMYGVRGIYELGIYNTVILFPQTLLMLIKKCRFARWRTNIGQFMLLTVSQTSCVYRHHIQLLASSVAWTSWAACLRYVCLCVCVCPYFFAFHVRARSLRDFLCLSGAVGSSKEASRFVCIHLPVLTHTLPVLCVGGPCMAGGIPSSRGHPPGSKA